MSRRVKDILKENNELEKQLSDDGKKVLTDIVVYLRGVPVSDNEEQGVKKPENTRFLSCTKPRNSYKSPRIRIDFVAQMCYNSYIKKNIRRGLSYG